MMWDICTVYERVLLKWIQINSKLKNTEKYRLNFNMFIISSLLYVHKIHYSYTFMVLSQNAAVSL